MGTDSIIDRCEAKGLRMTGQRRIIAEVMEIARDHPDVEEIYARASAIDTRPAPQPTPQRASQGARGG